jgi:hypothetical protein
MSEKIVADVVLFIIAFVVGWMVLMKRSFDKKSKEVHKKIKNSKKGNTK